MKKYKTHIHQSEPDGFFKRMYGIGKDMAAKHGVAGVIATVISSAFPLVQHYFPSHPAWATQASVQSSETRTDSNINSVRTEEDAKIAALWKEIGKLENPSSDNNPGEDPNH